MTYILKLSILLCIVLSTTFAYSDSSNWILKKKYDDVSIYTYKKSPNKESTRLIIKFKKSKIDPSKINKTFVKKTYKTKAKMLDFIKISNWTVKKTRIKNKKNMTRVIVSGFYKDPAKNKVYFKEYHFYSPKKQLQILLTNNNKKQLKKRATLSAIKKFRKKYKI